MATAVPSIVAALLLLAGSTDALTTAAYPVCVSGCFCSCCGCSVVVTGGAAATFCPVCGEKCAVACSCFSPDTMVATKRGPLPMDQIKAGDEVLSQVAPSGEVRFTAVRKNMESSGNFMFFETYVQLHPFQSGGADDGERMLLVNVTGTHPLVRLAEDEEDHGDATLIDAEKSLGVRLPVHLIESRRPGFGRVRRQTNSFGTKKNLLFTEHCNVVLANGLVVPTACSQDSLPQGNETVETLDLKMFSRRPAHVLSV